MTIRTWLHGLAAAVISAAADSGVALLGGIMFAPGLLAESRAGRHLPVGPRPDGIYVVNG